ncbi:MAG: hypothetical protein HC811_06865 [Flammeovirgaceae bacterium]|nr:hypothetical protein [Flammeovirgaceae bacterium]
MLIGNYDGSLTLYDFKERKSSSFSGLAKAIYSIDINSSGKLAVASQRNGVLLMDLTGFSDAKLVNQQSNVIKSLAFQPNSDILLTGSTDKVTSWDLSNELIVHSYGSSGEYSEAPIFFNSSTNSIYKKESPEGIEQFNLTDGKKNRIKVKDVFDFRFSSDGDRLFGKVFNQTIDVFDTKKFKRIDRFEFSDLKAFDLDQDDRTIAAVNGQTIEIIDIGTKVTKSSILFPDQVSATRIEFIPGTDFLATWNTSRAKFGSEDDYSIRIWDLTKGKMVSTLSGHSGTITSLTTLKNEFIFHQVSMVPSASGH